jgi:hypothetical protein
MDGGDERLSDGPRNGSALETSRTLYNPTQTVCTLTNSWTPYTESSRP